MNRYHIDVYNGLPSNHVYSTLVDRHGYLWICTDKGVVRYNGYEFKKFGLAEGLPNEDVWQMLEDKKGRIWLLSISDEIGYILNGQYKKAYIINPPKTLRPYNFVSYNEGVYFINPGNTSNVIGVERNDTIRFFHTPTFINYAIIAITAQNEILSIAVGKVYKLDYTLNGWNRQLVWETNDYNLQANINTELWMIFKNSVVSYKYNKDYIRVLDIPRHSYKVIKIDSIFNNREKIFYFQHYKNYLYLITDGHVYKLDTNYKIIKAFDKFSLLDNTDAIDKNLVYFIDDNFWGNCIATSTSGAYINTISKEEYKKYVAADLSNSRFVGNANDHTFYWYNDSRNILSIIERNDKVKNVRMNISNIQKIVPYNNHDTGLVLCQRDAYWIDAKNQITDIMQDKPDINDGSQWPYRINLQQVRITSYRSGMRDAIVDSMRWVYAVTAAKGVYKNLRKGHQIIVKIIDSDMYHKVVFDSLSGLFCAYDNNKILIFNKNGNKLKISKALLKAWHIENIETICVDGKYGNVFIKDYDKLLVYNYRTNAYYRVFNNYNLNGSFISVYGEKLIILGRFGLLHSKITGPGSLSNPIVYQNTKSLYYNFITDFQVCNNQVLLKTDKGAYITDIPHDEEFITNTNNEIPYKLLALYKGNLMDLKYNDTISINQSDLRLQFDVINPNGNGAVHYSYSLDNSNWQDLNANELNLSRLQSDKYYTLSMVAYDDAWRSNKVDINLYIIPYWWQTLSGKRMIWISGILIAAILGTVIVLITRRIVYKNNEKKSLQLGLELNAVYSQINPHFVFNTLNTAQYFIKKKKTDEAFIHINKFSRLLRAYIKSARNKFITIEEELGNLVNYIELQQERFEDKFDYQLIVDDREEIKQVKIPSLLLQPLVENAINHGLFHKEEKGLLKIEVKFGKNKNEVICVIDDDGIGRKRSKVLNANSVVKRESYGDQLINDLINIFNKYEQVNIKLEYIDKEEPQTGTIVILTIKNLQNDK